MDKVSGEGAGGPFDPGKGEEKKKEKRIRRKRREK
jgi:hypothetical protein